MMDEISNQLPGELKQAKTIVDSSNELIAKAKREAEGLVRQAQAQAKQLVSQEATYKEAQAHAEEMIRTAQALSLIHILREEKVPVPCEINVLLTDDGGIHAINLATRQVDRPTDVLSFPMFQLTPGRLPRDWSNYLCLLYTSFLTRFCENILKGE